MPFGSKMTLHTIPKPPKITKKSTQTLKKRNFGKSRLANTKHSKSRVQGPKNTPKVDQKRSQGHAKTQPNFSLIFASIFHRFFIDFGTPCGPLLLPKSLKMARRSLAPAALDPTWKLFLHRTPPKTPNGPKMDPKWSQTRSKMEPKLFQTGPKMKRNLNTF